MNLLWTDEAWEDYLRWQGVDKKSLRRVNQLIKEIQRSPHSGIGKPEPLKGDMAGWWSRRIDDANRIVYRQKGSAIEITQCGGHS
jgi:toxin YoeB